MQDWFYGVWAVLGLALCFLLGLLIKVTLEISSLLNIISDVDFQNRLFEALKGLSGVIR